MALIRVSTSEVRSKIQSLRDQNTGFNNQVNQLTNEENTLNAQWEGDANDAFHKTFTESAESMNRFYQEIEKFCQTLEEICRNYDAAEETNAGLARTRNY